MTLDRGWYMSTVTDRGTYQRGLVGTDIWDVIDGTQKRDVSPVLDLLALADTPFINKIGWGPESGGLSIEWISEDLGPGVITEASGKACDDASMTLGSLDGASSGALIRQLQTGSVIYHYCSSDTEHHLIVVASFDGDDILFSNLASGGGFVAGGSTDAANEKWYILGAFVNEGSYPRDPKPRARTVLSNTFNILRKDVAITGSMQKTDMYAIGREDAHQILMRLKEMQRERERVALYSKLQAKASTEAPMMNGVLGFLMTQTGSHIDATTKTLTETAVNDVVNRLWEYGGRNFTFFGPLKEVARFTKWDKSRVRTRVNETKGGGHITSYLTEAGLELDLVPMAHVPHNIAFVLDTSRIKLRAKRGRKAIMEKLGKMGDFDDWQILSEFSMQMKGYNLRQHGMFKVLAS